MMHATGTLPWHHYLYMYLYPTVVGLVVLTGIVYLIYWLFAQRGGNALKSQSPLDLLKIRYAKGEITDQQFQKMRRQLR